MWSIAFHVNGAMRWYRSYPIRVAHYWPWSSMWFRFGLPVNFIAIIIHPLKKSSKRLRDVLDQLFGYLDQSDKSKSDEVTIDAVRDTLLSSFSCSPSTYLAYSRPKQSIIRTCIWNSISITSTWIRNNRRFPNSSLSSACVCVLLLIVVQCFFSLDVYVISIFFLFLFIHTV